MDNIQHCMHCRYVGQFDFVHQKLICPKCKQMSAFGDCCQGSEEIPATFSGPKDACDVEGEDVPN
tara:strand:- start:127 stop:321 length:195 start_codon:yes stop_codon:yes gene_type:complete